MERIIIKAPAKINLGLNIISKRNDGFHNLETIFYPINDLFDIITFEKAAESSFSSNIELPSDSTGNLILKAKEKLEELTGRGLKTKIKLDKTIPIGAGLGGGSSDAAKTLIALNELYELKIKPYKIRSIALELGSDLPFFLNPVPSFAESRGELLVPLKFNIDFPILLVNPNIHISTKGAFQNITPLNEHIDYLKISSFSKQKLLKLNSMLKNDFEEYIFAKYPQIKGIKTEMRKLGAFFSMMSGTGSTVYGIFENLSDAKKAEDYFRDKYFTFLQKLSFIELQS